MKIPAFRFLKQLTAQARLLKVFWIFITTASLSYFLCRFNVIVLKELRGYFLEVLDPVASIFVLATGLLFFLGLLAFLFKPGAQLKTQELRNQPSWVLYFYWSFINSFIVWSVVSFLTEERGEWWRGVWWTSLSLALAIILLKWLNEWLRSMPDLTFKDFASGSVGIDGDRLNFALSAQHAAEGLKKLNDYVNVAAIYSGLGFGKSSYARMILESFDSKETLYTYISLTETNEAKDFSKLFAERWLQTLARRYPKFDVTSYLPFMYSILRESGGSVISEVLKIFSSLDRGLIKTKSTEHDKHYANPPAFVSETVAQIFGNIPVISESTWIIMVDEIERAQIDEVYRLVEIVERFKNEGRSGLPVKLIFIFCISEPDFADYLRSFSSKDPRVPPLRTFFYGDPKSITHRIFLPPVEPIIKYRYIDEEITKVAKKYEAVIPKEIYAHTFANPTFRFTTEHKDAMGYIVGILGQYSIRMVARIIIGIDFFLAAFRDRTGGLQVNAIRMSDLVALELIKIRYPFLIEFFLKTIHALISQTERNNMEAYHIRKELEEKKQGLPEWIERVTGHPLAGAEKQEVIDLVGLVMYYYFDFITRDYNVKTKDKYFGTTSYPEVLHDYLSLVSDSIETGYRKYSQIYQKRRALNEPSIVTGMDETELVGYARFLFELYEAPLEMNIEVIQELSKRLIDRKIKISPMRVEETLFDEALYQFIFQFVSLAEKESDAKEPSEEMQAAFDALKNVLTAKTLPVGAKLLLLNSLANYERRGMGDIHARLESAFQKLNKHFSSELKTLVQGVFKEFDGRYLDGHDVLYEEEENFFFTMYQSWSGSKNSKDQIAKIRAAAKRGLKSHPKALELYWSQYPLKDGWRDLDDVYREDVFFPRSENNGTLYMPLSDLVQITMETVRPEDKELVAKVKFWNAQQKYTRLQDQIALKDDPSTLRAVLTRRGLLESEAEIK